MFPGLQACLASFLLLNWVPEGRGWGTPDLWISGALGYLLSCHISLLSKLREAGQPLEEPVCLMIQDTWVWPPPPSFSGLRVIYRKRGWDPEGRRKGRLSRVDQEVGIGSSEKHTNFQFKKGLGLFPFTGCWGMSAMTPTRVNLSGGYGGGWPSLAQKAQSIYLTLELVPCKNTAIFF